MNTAPPSDERRQTNILLTGRPGIGKTTVITKLAKLLADKAIAGFCTGEIRHGGQRQGFTATTFTGDSGTLAHIRHRGRHRVGRYGVDVATFEELVLPELDRACDVVLIDEIGKMECFSPRFIEAARQLLDGPTPVVATVALSGGGFLAETRERGDAQLWQVTHENREELPQQIAQALSKMLTP